MTIVEFLLARIAEEEAIAQAATRDAPPPWSTLEDYDSGHDGGGFRVVDAEGRSVTYADAWYASIDEVTAAHVIRHSASVYSDHPDFDHEEWE